MVPLMAGRSRIVSPAPDISPRMKQLTLIRHAKSAHDHVLLRDFDRPLSDRGLRDAPLVARHLKEIQQSAPDALITSPALRARTTAEIIRREAALTHLPLTEEPRIYEAPVDTLAAVLRGIPDTFGDVLLFGHNPGLENLANWLCGQRAVYGLRTAGVILLELDVPVWQETGLGCAKLLTYFYPAQIGGGKDAHGA